jgi:hypothetical protein
MSFQPCLNSVYGSKESDSIGSAGSAESTSDVAASRDVVPVDGTVPDDFGRLVWLARSNQQLFGLLHALSDRLHGVRAYLAGAGCNARLGRAYYQHWRTRHSGVLLLLRANRLEARRLLARLDPEALRRCPVSRSSFGPPSRAPIHDPETFAFRPGPCL